MKGKDRREVLAKWLASPENPYFAKNLANIVWAHFIGKGIIDRWTTSASATRPSNPELLDALGKKFQEYNYDFKQLVRDICNSPHVSARDARPTRRNERDERNFAHAPVRRMRAEVLLDMHQRR